MNLPEDVHTLPKIQVLRLLLANLPEWQTWFQSNKCWLSNKEKLAVFNYLRYEEFELTARQLNITKERARQIFSKAFWKLIRSERYYKHWEQSTFKYGNVNEEITPEIKAFLNQPLEEFYLSAALSRGLDRCGFETAADTLKYSYPELKAMKKFGIKPLEHFIELLREHDCEFLMRDLEDPEVTLAEEVLEGYY